MKKTRAAASKQKKRWLGKIKRVKRKKGSANNIKKREKNDGLDYFIPGIKKIPFSKIKIFDLFLTSNKFGLTKIVL